MGDIVAGLSLINILVLALGLITGPLQARALGPAGRGELAAILVVSQQVPLILTFGLGAYATREIARGVLPGELVGSIGGLMFFIGLLILPAGILFSHLLGQGRPVVDHYIMISFLLLPISLLGILLSSLLTGLERWRLVVATRLIAMLLPAAAIIALYLLDHLTVGLTAAIVFVASMLSIAPALVALRGWMPLRFRMLHIRIGVPFGLQSWVAYLASMTNGRLDQLLMAALASSRQLGLYAVAVTVSSLPNVVIGAVGPPLLTRVAAGDRHLVPSALRVSLATVTIFGGMLAVASIVLIPLLFGSAFRDAVPMAAILLVAAVPLAGVAVLSSSFVADGEPSVPALGELVTLGITIPGLIVLLPRLGGVGAAIVSLGAYAVNLLIQLIMARRRFGASFATFLVPRLSDLRWALALVTRVTRRYLPRSRAHAP
jgi:O-antigen/teichoic acid export membrane protein